MVMIWFLRVDMMETINSDLKQELLQQLEMSRPVNVSWFDHFSCEEAALEYVCIMSVCIVY